MQPRAVLAGWVGSKALEPMLGVRGLLSHPRPPVAAGLLLSNPVGPYLLRFGPRTASVHPRRAVWGGAAGLQLLEAQVSRRARVEQGQRPYADVWRLPHRGAHATVPVVP